MLGRLQQARPSEILFVPNDAVLHYTLHHHQSGHLHPRGGRYGPWLRDPVPKAPGGW